MANVSTVLQSKLSTVCVPLALLENYAKGVNIKEAYKRYAYVCVIIFSKLPYECIFTLANTLMAQNLNRFSSLLGSLP